MKRKYCGILLFGFVFILLSTFNVYALPPLSNQDAIKLIEKRLNQSMILPIHTGNIVIKPMGLSLEEGPIYLGTEKNIHYFKYQVKRYYDAYLKNGLINMKENYQTRQSSFSRIAETSEGEKYYVSLTEKGKRLLSYTDEKGNSAMKLGEIKITKIVKNYEYKITGSTSGELRIIMGLTDYYPTEIGVEIQNNLKGANYKVNQSYKNKFKALLKYDPFQEKYQCAAIDMGDINPDKWYTNKVPE